MSLSYRRDSPISSPYGFAMKLAPKSSKIGRDVTESIIQQKRFPIAWFVTRRQSESKRERLVDELKVSKQILIKKFPRKKIKKLLNKLTQFNLLYCDSYSETN